MRDDRFAERAGPWLALAGLIAFWQAVCDGFGVREFIFPSPWQTGKALVAFAGPILKHAFQTLWTTVAGFAIGVAVGLLLGIFLGSSRLVYKVCYPLLIGFNSIPRAAFVPILVVWFGIGTIPAILTAFLICFFPIAANVATGLATVEPELEDVLRSLGATRLDILRKVGLPRSMPYFFASLKVAITLAFVGTVVSETVASNEGIGYLMMSAGSASRMPLVFAGLIVISAMAMLMYVVFAWLEMRITGWAHRGQQARA
jgi:NitT/TauT family transport system permease protein